MFIIAKWQYLVFIQHTAYLHNDIYKRSKWVVDCTYIYILYRKPKCGANLAENYKNLKTCFQCLYLVCFTEVLIYFDFLNDKL